MQNSLAQRIFEIVIIFFHKIPSPNAKLFFFTFSKSSQIEKLELTCDDFRSGKIAT